MSTTPPISDQQQMLKFAANSLVSDLLKNASSFANKLEVAKLCASDKELLQECIQSKNFLNSISMQNSSPQKDLMLEFIKSCTKGDRVCSELIIEKITRDRGTSLSATCNLFEALELECEICDNTVLENFLINYLGANFKEMTSRRSYTPESQELQNAISLIHRCFTVKNVFSFLSNDSINKLLSEVDKYQKDIPHSTIAAVDECMQSYENNDININTFDRFAQRLAKISYISRDTRLLLLRAYEAITVNAQSQDLVNKVIYEHPYAQEITKILKISDPKEIEYQYISKITKSKNLMTCTEIQKHLKTNEDFALQILKKIQQDYNYKDRLDYNELKILDSVTLEFINIIVNTTHSSPALALGLISLSNEEKIVESILLWKKSLEEKKLIDSCLQIPTPATLAPTQFKV